MDEFLLPECVHNHGVICGARTCEKCGWNPDVIEKRKTAIRMMGVTALAKNPEGFDEMYAVKYILKNCKDYGGEMIHAEMQKNLGISYAAYQTERRKAKNLVRKMVLEELACM